MMSTTATPEPIPYWRGLIRQYASFLPVEEDTPIVSLHEGNTPLIHCERLVKAIGGEFDLYLKFEGLNPTASFKDRGMTMAMTKAVEKGAQVVICASTGNTSASAAAYAARAKLKCVVILPDGNIAMGKLAQALMYGAQTIAIRGNFDEALNIVRELGETGKVEIVNSINPFRIEGQKTASFRYATNWGVLRIFTFYPWAMLETLQPTGKATRNTTRRVGSHPLPRCAVIRRQVLLPSLMVTRWNRPRPWPLPFESAIRPAGKGL